MDVFYQSRTSEVYGGTLSLILLATILVVARLVARKTSAANIWWDDFTIVVALVLDWGLSSCYWMEIRWAGLGRHTLKAGGPAGPDEIYKFFKLFLAIQVMYFASAVAIKTSLILLYYRIFGVIRWFRWLLAAMWSIVVLYFVVCVLVAVFECSPVQFYWNKSVRTGRCIDQNQFYRWNGVANLLIDFAIWTLPMPVIWTLNLNRRQKWSLSAVFLLGLFACVASIVRVVGFNWIDFNDITYTIVSASIWTTIEQSLGIICACLPTTRPLFGRLLHNIKHSTGHSSDPTPQEAAPRSAIPRPHYASRPAVGGAAERSWLGFSRLSEENTGGVSLVTAHASTASDDLPIMLNGIIKQQRVEQRVENSV